MSWGQAQEAVSAHLGNQGLLWCQGTIVDATIIQASSRLKTKEDQRDDALKPL